MKRYCYIRQRQSKEFLIREIIAVECPLVVNDKQVNQVNNFATKINNNVTESITYLKEVEGRNLKDLKKELEKLVAEKRLSCRYEWEGKDYLIICKVRRAGVWRDNDLIIHQIKPHMIEPTIRTVCLGESEQDCEMTSHEFVKYYKEWKKKLLILLSYNYNYFRALQISFALTFNSYLNNNITIERAVQLRIKHLAIRNNSFVTLGITKVNSREQFNYYIKPTYSGKANCLSPILDFYSSVEGRIVQNAFNYFVADFSNYLIEE